MVTGLGMGTLAAQEDPLGDVIQPESGGLSPSDAVNPGLRAGGGARSRPSSGGGAGGGRVLFSPRCSFQALGDQLVPPNTGAAAYFPASTVQCQPPQETLPLQPPQESWPTWRVMLVNTAPPSREGQRWFPSAGPRPACECPRPAPLLPLFTDLTPCCVLVPHGSLFLGKELTLQPEEQGRGRCPGLPEGHPGHAPQGEDPMGRQPSPGIV